MFYQRIKRVEALPSISSIITATFGGNPAFPLYLNAAVLQTVLQFLSYLFHHSADP